MKSFIYGEAPSPSLIKIILLGRASGRASTHARHLWLAGETTEKQFEMPARCGLDAGIAAARVHRSKLTHPHCITFVAWLG